MNPLRREGRERQLDPESAHRLSVVQSAAESTESSLLRALGPQVDPDTPARQPLNPAYGYYTSNVVDYPARQAAAPPVEVAPAPAPAFETPAFDNVTPLPGFGQDAEAMPPIGPDYSQGNAA